ncbi:E4 SUMO-protein ligase PIAL2 isoform X1 [Brassica napus]|uniref:E4 SUMO-protein ligase PIAL2 isoform X1 n=1 Tax=Brassica napus TaxID=3708 RepID=UPI0020785FB0|nr:E4 SUMO-protein ligase PIAL2 isoform X1 [Brassica napus]
MSSTTLRPVDGTGLPEKAAAALVNSFRLASVTQRLAFHIQGGSKSDVKEFQICCISLAKGIDFAIANNEIPKEVENLPSLLKQVCQYRNDVYTKTAVMVLMISVKHACKLGWFSDSEGQELIALADQMKNVFGTPENTSLAIQSPGGTLSQIMERFYPFVKLGHVLVSLEVKAGYTILAHDFHISKNMPHSPKERIRLFVVQTDNIYTSACLINPQEVSFMLNGKVVDKRVNISMDSGPQLPTNVTAILKYGTNLLQVMGDSKGHYIIVIAFTGTALPPEKPVLKEYIQSGAVESTPDSDIIEGPSRVSLRCPISHSQIKLPVKGQLCKHLQCFDFSNYVYINMRKPSWRCPHCNQPVSYPEIRLDQNMVKILKEAGHKAADVIIHAGGTWKVGRENNGNEEPVRDVIHYLEDPNSLFNAGPVVLDLTGDDENDADIELFGNTNKVVDQKPHLADAQGQSNNNNGSKDPSAEDYCSMFNFSDVISLDQVMLDQLSTGTGQEYSQIPMPQDPTPVPALLSQAPSPGEIPATTSTVFPSPQFSQVHASPVTPTGTYLNRISSQRPLTTSSSQSRRQPVQVTSQSPGNVSSLAQPPRIPRVLSGQPNSYFVRSLNNGHVTTQTQRPSSPPVQSVSRISDLMDVDSATTDTTNWRPRMRGSISPGSYSPALDHMIIRPTQQSQSRLHGSQPAQTPPVHTSQTQPPFSTAPPAFTRPSGPTAPWRT